MKIEVCSCCGKIIDGEKYKCGVCGSNYCSFCKKLVGENCFCCGEIGLLTDEKAQLNSAKTIS